MSFWSRVEAKVKSASFVALLASAAIALLNALVGDSQLLGGLPPWLQFVIVTAVPSVLTFLAGYISHHSAPTLDSMLDSPSGRARLARVGYGAYARSTGGKTFDGRIMPAYDDLGDQVQAAWADAGAAQLLANRDRA